MAMEPFQMGKPAILADRAAVISRITAIFPPAAFGRLVLPKDRVEDTRSQQRFVGF
jgi:hypothetical protein